jgi:hypothetical protein
MTLRVASLLAAMMVSLCISTPGVAQATRTWVSGVGDDANPCSRTAPCRTWAGTISKTAPHGEMDSLDPGGFGAITITKGMLLDGGGGQVSSIVNSATNAVVVAAGPADVVMLRNLRLNGGGTGLDGVKIISAGLVVLDNVEISGNTQYAVELVLGSGACTVVIRNSNFTGGMAGVRLTSGSPGVTLDHVSIRGAATGVDATVGTVDVKESSILQASAFGVHAEGGSITVFDSLLSGDAVALQAETGSTVRASNSDLFNNQAGFGCGGGQIASGGNNRKGGNAGGTGPVCAPTATIVVQ